MGHLSASPRYSVCYLTASPRRSCQRIVGDTAEPASLSAASRRQLDEHSFRPRRLRPPLQSRRKAKDLEGSVSASASRRWLPFEHVPGAECVLLAGSIEQARFVWRFLRPEMEWTVRTAATDCRRRDRAGGSASTASSILSPIPSRLIVGRARLLREHGSSAVARQ